MKPTKYYFWSVNHRGDWQASGCLYGYNTAKACRKDMDFSIEVCEVNGYEWTILEAKPMTEE